MRDRCGRSAVSRAVSSTTSAAIASPACARSKTCLPIHFGTAGLPVSSHHTRCAHLVLEAALQAALGLQRIAADRQIADLTGGAVLAANQAAVDIESQSDAAAERKERHVIHVLRAAMPYFPEQREIDVIFKDDGTTEFLQPRTLAKMGAVRFLRRA